MRASIVVVSWEKISFCFIFTYHQKMRVLHFISYLFPIQTAITITIIKLMATIATIVTTTDLIIDSITIIKVATMAIIVVIVTIATIVVNFIFNSYFQIMRLAATIESKHYHTAGSITASMITTMMPMAVATRLAAKTVTTKQDYFVLTALATTTGIFIIVY